MRKNILAVSIAAMIGGLGFAGAASAAVVIPNTGAIPVDAAGTALAAATALAVNPAGVGHILTVPYFSTQNGNVSLLNITNTDLLNGKAVKVRFRGAANSDDIFDITVFLSPGDIWSANISQKNGVSTLETTDNSCTLPSVVNAPFSTNRVGGATQDAKNAQTLEGYVEILNMADVPPTLVTAATGVTTGGAVNALFTTIKHKDGVAPCGSTTAGAAELDKQVNDVVAYAAADANSFHTRGYNFPTGGLMANWSIINLSKAGSFTGEATAVVASSSATAIVPGAANIVFSPQTPASVSAADVNKFTADPLLRQNAALAPIVQAANYDLPDLSTPYTGVVHPITQANNLSKALAVQSVFNEYLTNPSVSFGTDWVFSMPTRRYGVALNYAATGGGAAVFNAIGTGDGAAADAAPVPAPASGASLYFDASNSIVNSTKDLICVKPGSTGLQYFDHSEQTTKGGFVISPGSVATLEFCGETSVLAFNNTGDSVLGSKIARKNISTQKSGGAGIYTDGWLKVGTPGLASAGLPVAGHAYVKALSSTANLGGTWRHRSGK